MTNFGKFVDIFFANAMVKYFVFPQESHEAD
jgi:hypothetical protein